MSVIIRLQNLPWSANALDIRNFFRGLSIPDGGVHIVGGEMGDAFIAFSTDEDARQAMMQDRGKINEVQIRLLLSSRAEMQKVIETARQQSLAMQLQMSTPTVSATLSQKVALPTPQPPVITSNSLHNILSNQPSQIATSFDSSRSYTSISQQHKSHYPASVESRSSRETSRDRRRSNSRERRRSRSSDRGASRRRRDRSRSHDRKYRRSSRRSKSRDRSHERSRERSHERNKEKDRGEIRGSRKGSKEIEMTAKDRLADRRNVLEKSIEKDGAKALPAANVWEIQPTNAYTTSNFVATYAYQALQNVSLPALNIAGLNSPLTNFVQSSMKSNFNSPTGNDSSESTANSSKSGLSSSKVTQEAPSSSFFNAGQLENKPKFAFQNPYTQANVQSNFGSDSKQISMMTLGKDRKTDDSSANLSNAYSSKRFSQFNQTNMSQNENSGKGSEASWPSASINEPDAFGRNLPNKHDSSRRDIDEEKSCIKITNMCPSTSYSDIRRFFSGLYIPNNGIKMINDQHGLRVGTAYIRFVRALNVPKALVRDGTQFKSKKISLEPVSDAEFDAAVDSFKPSRNQRFPNNDSGKPNYEPMRFSDNIKDDEPPKSMKIKEKSPERSFSILFVKDIPAYSTQQDIMKMFSSYTIVDILLTNRPDNRREIIAYVKFHRVEDAQAAYAEKSSHRINQRPVRVTISTEEEYERAKEELRIATERQLKEQQELEELEKRKQAEAEAEAEAQAVAEMAQKETDHDDEENSIECDPNPYTNTQQNTDFDQNEEIIDDFDGDQIDLTKGQPNCSNPFSGIPSLLDIPAPVNLIEPEKNTDPRLRRNRPSRFDNPENEIVIQQTGTNFIIVKNCEYKTSIQTVGEYFMSHDLMPIHVESLRNHRNQPCGEFIIEFRTNEDAEQAICLNNSRLNSRVIRISPITPQQIADRLNKPFMNYFPSSMSNNMSSPGARSNFNNAPGNFNNNRGANATERNEFPFDFQNRNQNQNNSIRANNSSNGGNNNKAASRGGGNQANASNNRTRGRFGNNPQNFNPFKDVNNENEFLESSPIKIDDDTNDGGMPEKFRRPGCVVEMENVPYRADLGDIIDFFDGYNVQAEDIIRRYNDDGTPTGDARVAFGSVAEAKAAFEAKRQKSIFNRTIFLNIL